MSPLTLTNRFIALNASFFPFFQSRYCSKSCQFEDWKDGHSRNCKRADVNTETVDQRQQQQPVSKRPQPKKAIFMEDGLVITSCTYEIREVKRLKETIDTVKREGTLKVFQVAMSKARETHLISSVRLHAVSNRSLRNLNLKLEAELAVSRGHYRDAVRCLTLAIDKLEMERSSLFQEICAADKHPPLLTTDVNALMLLYRRRVWCQMKVCEHPRINSVNKLKNLTSMVQDCAFLLRTGLFADLIRPGTDMYNELAEIEASALLSRG
jgi:hypothetical protein